MKKANLHEAKTHLSKLVDLASKGEEVIICRAGEPVARLTAIKGKKSVKKTRKAGAWKGKVKMSDDFDETPKEFMKYFE